MELAHYTAIGNLERIVKSDGLHLHMSRFSDMDEPHEIKWAEKELKRAELLEPEDCENNDKSYPYVLSMSDKIDDMTMWRLFGGDGKGICFVFNSDKIYISDAKPRTMGDDTPNCFCGGVMYGIDNKENLISITSIAKHLHDVGLFSNELLCSFLKPDAFDVEHEYRFCHIHYGIIFVSNGNGEIQDVNFENSDQINIKETSRGLVRYVEKIFSPEALVKIIVGWKTPESTVEIIESHLRALGISYQNVMVEKSKYPLI